MKKLFTQYIQQLGGQTAYAGNTEKWTPNKKGDGYDIRRNLSTIFVSKLEETFMLKSNIKAKFGAQMPFRIVFQQFS